MKERRNGRRIALAVSAALAASTVGLAGGPSPNNFVLTHVPHTAMMFAAGDSNQGGVILARG